MTPIAVLLAAADTARHLLSTGAQITTTSTAPGTFRLEGSLGGKRLVLVAVFTERGGQVEATVARQLGRTARERKATAADHTAAVLAALA
jgi:hypothetical protein